jgi:cAMP-dependent protein kinase regulator
MEAVKPNKYLTALQQCPLFDDLNSRQLNSLLHNMTPKKYPAETKLITEGEPTNYFAVIIDGEAEVSVVKHKESELQAILTTSDIIGLIEANQIPQPRIAMATVTTKTDIILLIITDEKLREFLQEHPGIANSLKKHAQYIRAHHFIKNSVSLSAVSNPQAKELAKCVRPLCVKAKTLIIQQGEIGSECFLILKGKVAVIYTNKKGEQRVLKELSNGEIFGETALIAQQPRNASVQATEDTQLYILDSEDFLKVVETEKSSTIKCLICY